MAELSLPAASRCRTMTYELLIYWQDRITGILEARAQFMDSGCPIEPSYERYLRNTSNTMRLYLMAVAQEIQHRETLLDAAFDVRMHIGPVSSC